MTMSITITIIVIMNILTNIAIATVLVCVLNYKNWSLHYWHYYSNYCYLNDVIRQNVDTGGGPTWRVRET